jgi:raffinose/stachyose/melibiose transport system permease protein
MESTKQKTFSRKILNIVYDIVLFFAIIVVGIVYTVRNGVKFIALGIAWPVRWIDRKLFGDKLPISSFFAKVFHFLVVLCEKVSIGYRKLIDKIRKALPRLTEDIDRIFLGEGDTAQNNRVFFYFLLPALASFIIMVIIPFFFGIYYSMTDWGGIGEPNFIGLDNYQGIFSDPKFYYSFYRTALYAVLNIMIINVVAFALATIVTQKLKLTNLYRAGFFMPNLIGGLILGFIFRFIFVNGFLAIGDMAVVNFISKILNYDFFDKNLLTSGASNSMIALLIVVTWQYAGYIMMIYVAAIQNIPQQLVEAAKIDGASVIQRFRHITLPLVAQAFTVAMFLTLVTAFKQFDTVFAMTSGGPIAQLPEFFGNIFNLSSLPPVDTLDLMAVNIYNTAFARRLFALGQAKAIVFFVILLVISLLQVYYNKKREVEL